MAAPAPEPLSPLTMAILVALAEQDLHGFALIRTIEAQTDGSLRPGTGSLYSALQRLLEDGLITESPDTPEPGPKSRRAFRITAAGRAAGEREAARMVRVLERAQRNKLVRDLPKPREAR
jgi:DNA-binding PadR family transcriptional regulator